MTKYPSFIKGYDLLDLDFFPFSALENDGENDGIDHIGKEYRPVDESYAPFQVNGCIVGQRSLQEPETKEVDPGRGFGISTSVEGLRHDHPKAKYEIAQGNNLETVHGGLFRQFSSFKKVNDLRSEKEEDK